MFRLIGHFILSALACTLFEWLGFYFFGLPGVSYARWIFYGSLAAGLIAFFKLGLGLQGPKWSRTTLCLTALIVLSLLLYGIAFRVFDLPRLPWERGLLTFFVFVVWCPVFEEIVFRQALQQYWKSLRISLVPVCIGVSLLFALYHPGFLIMGEMLGWDLFGLRVSEAHRSFVWLQIPDTFIAGLIFSVLRESSGSTSLCIVLHAVFNGAFLFLI